MKFGLKTNPANNATDSHHHTSLTKPCDSEIIIFRQHLENAAKAKGDIRILILGCSPELREIAANMKAKTTVIANDLEVIERTTKMMRKRNKNEEWLEGNIMNLPLKKASFDVIFGDHVLSNVSPYNKESFYERMKEVLKSDGFIVIRSVVFKKTTKPFENKILKYFQIVDKKFGKEGLFSEYFPIYLMRPK